MRTRQRTTSDFWERSLLISSILALLLLALGLAITSPAHAAGAGSGAEKLRRLDLMLMVTALRCRTTRDDFEVDYSRFVARQRPTLQLANAQLRAELGARLGSHRAQLAYDRFSTSAANHYGQGHPWLDCGELRHVARALADVQERAALEDAADRLLAPTGSSRLAFAGR
ncbi:MAG: S-adenosyl-L-homocysteine hydrolase [Novosphingobium sp.]